MLFLSGRDADLVVLKALYKYPQAEFPYARLARKIGGGAGRIPSSS